jgi:hypothetical protein
VLQDPGNFPFLVTKALCVLGNGADYHFSRILGLCTLGWFPPRFPTPLHVTYTHPSLVRFHRLLALHRIHVAVFQVFRQRCCGACVQGAHRGRETLHLLTSLSMSSQVLKLEVVPAGTWRCTLSDGTETLEAVALSKVTFFGLAKVFLSCSVTPPLVKHARPDGLCQMFLQLFL